MKTHKYIERAHVTSACDLEATSPKMIPTQDLLDIMEFALDNTFTKDRHGKIVRQTKGIPMGDPHSPGMAIITCAWMEKEWMNTLSSQDKTQFCAARFRMHPADRAPRCVDPKERDGRGGSSAPLWPLA